MNLQRYYDISQTTELPALQDRLVSFANDMGFPLVTAAVVIEDRKLGIPPAFHVLSNMPEAFKATSSDHSLSRRDPVNRRLKTMSVPFIYDQSLYVREGAADIWERQAPYGYRNGIAVALHLSDNRHFLLGVDRDSPLPRPEAKVVRLMADLQLLAVHAQAAALQLLAPQEISPASLVRLTPRELEILRWTMDGKSAWDIGLLLGIAEGTVNFHLRNVCGKFNVASKHHAVLKALSVGLLA